MADLSEKVVLADENPPSDEDVIKAFGSEEEKPDAPEHSNTEKRNPTRPDDDVNEPPLNNESGSPEAAVQQTATAVEVTAQTTPAPDVAPPATDISTPAPQTTPQKKQKLVKRLLRSKKFIIAVSSVLVVIVGIVGLTSLKYSVLGLVIKKDVVIEVVDEKTLQPVSGVTVSISGKSNASDSKGQTNFSGLSLGKKKITLEKTGYTTKTHEATITLATKKLEPIRIAGTGYPMSFMVKDKISGDPIREVKLQFGDSESLTNEKGEAIISVPPSGGAKLTLTASKDGFNTTSQEVEVKENAPIAEVTLTPSGTVLYISNKSQKYDLYASDYDGKNERVILAATGKENQGTRIYPSPDGSFVALFASREGRKTNYNSTAEELYVINVSNGQYKKVENDISDFSWFGNTLVASWYGTDIATNAKIFSYNAESGQKKTILDRPGQFTVTNNKVYITLGDESKPDYGLFSYNLDGSGKKKLSSTPYTTYQIDSTSLVLNDYISKSNAKLKLSDDTIQKIDDPGDGIQYIYPTFSKDGSVILYTRTIDSNSQLFKANADNTNERQLTKSAQVSPSFFLSPNGKYAIFYGTIGTDTGAYIIPIEGGTPQKIANAHILQPSRGGI